MHARCVHDWHVRSHFVSLLSFLPPMITSRTRWYDHYNMVHYRCHWHCRLWVLTGRQGVLFHSPFFGSSRLPLSRCQSKLSAAVVPFFLTQLWQLCHHLTRLLSKFGVQSESRAFKLHKSFLGNEASDFIYRAGGIPLHASLPKERAGLVRPLPAAVYSTGSSLG